MVSGLHPRRLLISAGVALLTTLAALLLAERLKGAPVSFFMYAILVTAAVRGLWAGLFAVVLSQFAFSFYLAGLPTSSAGEMSQPRRQLIFAFAGLAVVAVAVAQRRSAEAAARARDDLAASLVEVRELWQRTFRAQDDERRRIALLLHDTTGQDLAALKMQLSRLDRTAISLTHEQRQILRESIELSEQSMNSLRTQAYLLYPPFLDEMGLIPALRWFAKGFSERSGIIVTLDLPDQDERLPPDVERTLFRAVQEALLNTHRHSQSKDAHIRLQRTPSTISIEVEDHGCGLSANSVRHGAGGGIAGMREQLRQLRGSLAIDSRPTGTTIRASVPLP